MSSARYFRLISLEVYGYRFNLTLSELRLYASGSAVDGSATMSCVGAPTAGSLANLIDGNTATSCTFDGAEVLLPGFYLQWDLGSTTAVDEMRVTGVSQATWLHRFTLQSSDDAITWVDISGGIKTRWPGTAVAAVMSVPVSNMDDVVLLLHGDGENGSTTIIDSSSSPKVITCHGNACVSTSHSKFGGSAIYFDGTGDYLTAEDSSAWAIGQSDFGIAFSMYAIAFATNHSFGSCLVDTRGASQSYQGFALFINNSGAITTWDANAIAHTSASGVVSTNVMLDISAYRSGGVQRVFVNGISVIEYASTYNHAGQQLTIASVVDYRDSSANFKYTGYLDEILITNGTAAQVSDFAPPTKPFVISDATPLRPRSDRLSTRFTGPTVGNVQQSVNVRNPNAIADNSNGPGTITGTVKEKAIPSNLPLSRKVRLMRERDGKCVREMWSDPVTGAWAFTGLDLSQAYTAVAWDYEHTYRATIADNLAATR